MAIVIVGDFEWDSSKDEANRRKHGISFVVAASVFLDEHAIAARDLEHPGRFILIGMSGERGVLFVISAEAGERIRIISARKASPVQRRVYEHGAKERD
jgi:uncharacterized DUF497 family protein